MVVEGPAAVVRGYLAGWLVGSGHALGDILIGDDLHVAGDGIIEQCATWLKFHQPRLHLLVPQQLVDPLRSAFTTVGTLFRTQVLSDRLVKSASFPFSYAAYNPRSAAEIDHLLTGNPGRITLSDDYRPTQLPQRPTDCTELGATMSEQLPATAPFEVTGKGTAQGDVFAILDLHARCREVALMDVGIIHLQFAA